jgi:hypothetical protein
MKFTQEIKYFDNEDYHFFFLNSYSFDSNINRLEILESYIHSDHFLDKNFFKFSVERSSAHGPFNISDINTSDFRKYNPSDIETIINDLMKEDDWGEDLKDFIVLWERSKKYLHDLNLQNGTLFHINMYWLKTNNLKVWDDFGQYTYFMLFIYISQSEKRLIAFDFGFD